MPRDHRLELAVAGGEMQDGACENDVGGSVGERSGARPASTRKFSAGICGASRPASARTVCNRRRIMVTAGNIVAVLQQVHEITAGAAARIQDPHTAA